MPFHPPLLRNLIAKYFNQHFVVHSNWNNEKTSTFCCSVNTALRTWPVGRLYSSRYKLQGKEGGKCAGMWDFPWLLYDRKSLRSAQRSRQTTVTDRHIQRGRVMWRPWRGTGTLDRSPGSNPRPLLKPLCFACKHCWPYNTQWAASVPPGPVKTCFDCPCHKWLKKT